MAALFSQLTVASCPFGGDRFHRTLMKTMKSFMRTMAVA